MKTMTTTQKKRTAILAAIVLTALIAVMLASVSCSTESDDGIELTDAVLSEQIAEEIVTDVNLDGEVEADVLEQKNVESFEAASANPETASTAAGQSQAPRQDIQRLTDSDSNAPASASSGSPSDSAPSKHWVEDTQQVWIEDRAAWTEQVPIYSAREVSICNVCGHDITGNTSTHAKAHMMAGEGSGHHSEARQTVSGYNTTNHPAEGHYETKVVGGHWE